MRGHKNKPLVEVSPVPNTLPSRRNWQLRKLKLCRSTTHCYCRTVGTESPPSPILLSHNRSPYDRSHPSNISDELPVVYRFGVPPYIFNWIWGFLQAMATIFLQLQPYNQLIPNTPTTLCWPQAPQLPHRPRLCLHTPLHGKTEQLHGRKLLPSLNTFPHRCVFPPLPFCSNNTRDRPPSGGWFFGFFTRVLSQLYQLFSRPPPLFLFTMNVTARPS